MSDVWLRRIQDGEPLRLAKSVQASLERCHTENEVLAIDLNRVRTQAAWVTAQLEHADPLLSPGPVLGQIEARLIDVEQQLAQFEATSDPSYVAASMVFLDDAVSLTRNLVVVDGGGGATEIIAATRETSRAELARISSVAETELGNLQAAWEELERHRVELAVDVEALRGQVLQHQAAMAELIASSNSTLGSFQTAYTTEQQERAAHYRGLVEAFETSADVKLGQVDERLAEKLTSFSEEGDQLLTHANQQNGEIDTLVGLVSEKALIGDYSLRAGADSTAADFWRWAAVVLGIAAAVVGVVLLATHHTSGSTDWEAVTLKALVVVAISGIAAYAVRQSTEHRHAQRENEHVALQLAAIKPYVAGLDDVERQALLAEVARRLFGQPRVEVSQNLLDGAGPGTGQLVAVVLEVLKSQGTLK